MARAGGVMASEGLADGSRKAVPRSKTEEPLVEDLGRALDQPVLHLARLGLPAGYQSQFAWTLTPRSRTGGCRWGVAPTRNEPWPVRQHP